MLWGTEWHSQIKCTSRVRACLQCLEKSSPFSSVIVSSWEQTARALSAQPGAAFSRNCHIKCKGCGGGHQRALTLHVRLECQNTDLLLISHRNKLWVWELTVSFQNAKLSLAHKHRFAASLASGSIALQTHWDNIAASFRRKLFSLKNPVSICIFTEADVSNFRTSLTLSRSDWQRQSYFQGSTILTSRIQPGEPSGHTTDQEATIKLLYTNSF